MSGVVVYSAVFGRPLVWDGTALRLTTDHRPEGTAFASMALAREAVEDSVAHYTEAGLTDSLAFYLFEDPRQRRKRTP